MNVYILLYKRSGNSLSKILVLSLSLAFHKTKKRIRTRLPSATKLINTLLLATLGGPIRKITKICNLSTELGCIYFVLECPRYQRQMRKWWQTRLKKLEYLQCPLFTMIKWIKWWKISRHSSFKNVKELEFRLDN